MGKELTYNATLVERVDYTDALATFKIEPDEPLPGERPFLPGQYVTLGMNNEARPELGSVRRPMSIASAPEEGAVLEFYIRWVAHPESDNPLTHLLWRTRAGDRLFLRAKAVGRFTLEHTVGSDDRRHKLLVAAGTGLAPFISMVRSHHLRHPQAELAGYTILHGASYPADLGYREELLRLAAERRLGYYATVSRPREAPDWPGDQGRVEDYFLPGRLEELEARLGFAAGGLNPENAVVYICGLQGTIGETIIRLLPRGFVPDNRKLRRALEVPDDVPASLFFEQYDATPVIDVGDPELMGRLRAQLRAALAVA
ncbi:MAG: hypothetical protein D6696_10390 [Acidobacteria bacterium]|nr:MAG: hypothetical protein D6696_10390 [Acidobacteriota bacterium]